MHQNDRILLSGNICKNRVFGREKGDLQGWSSPVLKSCHMKDDAETYTTRDSLDTHRDTAEEVGWSSKCWSHLCSWLAWPCISGFSFPLRPGDYDFEGPSQLSEPMISHPHINPNLRKNTSMALPVLWSGRPGGFLGLPREGPLVGKIKLTEVMCETSGHKLYVSGNEKCGISQKRRCGRQKNVHPHPNTHFLIPAVYDCHLTRNGMIRSNQVRDLGRRSLSWIIQRVLKAITGVFTRGMHRRSDRQTQRREENLKAKAEAGVMWP